MGCTEAVRTLGLVSIRRPSGRLCLCSGGESGEPTATPPDHSKQGGETSFAIALGS